jgi:hypothetical protein
MPSAKDKFLKDKPFSIKVSLEPHKNRGGDLPTEFGPTTQMYPYLTYQELRLVQKTVIDALYDLGKTHKLSSDAEALLELSQKHGVSFEAETE